MRDNTNCLSLHAIIVVVAISWGCATTHSSVPFRPEPFAGPTDTVVYFYRVSSILGGAIGFPVKVNDTVVAKLPQGAYWVVHLPPGVYKFRLGAGGAYDEINLDAKPGQVHCIRLDGTGPREVAADEAWPEMKATMLDKGE